MRQRTYEAFAARRGAHAPKAVAARNASEPGVGVEHNAVHKPRAQKSAPDKKDENGKDEH